MIGRRQVLANTPQGWAVHAMVLDIDVGLMLQTHKLLGYLCARQGLHPPVDCGELENDEPDRDGTGLDMVTMPQGDARAGADSNFFQRSGYERNPVAIQHGGEVIYVSPTSDGFQPGKPGARSWRRCFRPVSLLS